MKEDIASVRPLSKGLQSIKYSDEFILLIHKLYPSACTVKLITAVIYGFS